MSYGNPPPLTLIDAMEALDLENAMHPNTGRCIPWGDELSVVVADAGVVDRERMVGNLFRLENWLQTSGAQFCALIHGGRCDDVADDCFFGVPQTRRCNLQ